MNPQTLNRQHNKKHKNPPNSHPAGFNVIDTDCLHPGWAGWGFYIISKVSHSYVNTPVSYAIYSAFLGFVDQGGFGDQALLPLECHWEQPKTYVTPLTTINTPGPENTGKGRFSQIEAKTHPQVSG